MSDLVSSSQSEHHSHSIHLLNIEQGTRERVVHSYILFRNHEGHDAMALHGLPMKRRDGSFTLRGVLDQPSQSQINIASCKVLSEVELFRGSGEAYLCKMICAGDAVQYLNTQNVDFFPQDDETAGPNSVAYSLVQVMGLAFSDEAAKEWHAGQARNILPEGWVSDYVGGEGDPQRLLSAFQKQMAILGARAVQHEAWNTKQSVA